MKRRVDTRRARRVDVDEGGGAGAKPPQPQFRRATSAARLAQALWDLHGMLVRTSSDEHFLQELGDFWDEHKHHLEAMMRKGF